MKYFVLVYDQRRRVLIERCAFADPQDAVQARRKFEDVYLHEPHVETVVLQADSWGSVERTHARYFQSAEKIASRGLSLSGS